VSSPLTPSGPTIAVIFFDGYLGTAPTVVAAIDALARDGFHVDVITRQSRPENPPVPTFDPSRVRVISLPPREDDGSRHVAWDTAGWLARLRMLPRKVAARLADHRDRVRLVFAARQLARERYHDLIVGVDDEGVIAAAMVPEWRDRPLLYWSLEIDPYAGMLDPLRQFVRAWARRRRQRAALTVVQDQVRSDALRATGPVGGTVHFVPNSPAGPGTATRTHWFHRKFGLPDHQKVILHAGAVIPEMLSLELATAARSWPAEWTLVFHERVVRSPDDPYLRRVAAAGGDRVRLSLAPVPYRELDNIFAAADVSLVLYSSAVGDNFHLIASASGKMAHSLRVRVPVVCLDLPGLGDIVRQYGCGEVVASVGALTASVRKIIAEPDGYADGAERCYRELFDFGLRFAPVLAAIRSIIDPPHLLDHVPKRSIAEQPGKVP
jgi:glycosyltransferase involved in cell wall biosynthesis